MHSPGYEINAMMVASPKRLEFLPQQKRGRPLGTEEVVVGLRDVRNTSNGKPSIRWESDFSMPLQIRDERSNLFQMNDV
jgi:hypothetical protein